MKLINNFKNPEKMIRESRKNLPENFLTCKTVRRGYGHTGVTKQMIKLVITSESEFLDVFFSCTEKYKVFNQYLCPVSFDKFFDSVPIVWFMARFGFETKISIKQTCKLYTSLLNKEQIWVMEMNHKRYIIQ